MTIWYVPSVYFRLHILKLRISPARKYRDLCSDIKSPSLIFPFTLKSITISQGPLLLGRYLSRLSSTSPSSLHRRIHLLTEAFTHLILMSHGGRGLTGNQDKQKSVIQAPQSEITFVLMWDRKTWTKLISKIHEHQSWWNIEDRNPWLSEKKQVDSLWNN